MLGLIIMIPFLVRQNDLNSVHSPLGGGKSCLPQLPSLPQSPPQNKTNEGGYEKVHIR